MVPAPVFVQGKDKARDPMDMEDIAQLMRRRRGDTDMLTNVHKQDTDAVVGMDRMIQGIPDNFGE